MSRDPIVDEVRETRQRILKECGDDLDKLLDRLKAAEAKDHDLVVTAKRQHELPEKSATD